MSVRAVADEIAQRDLYRRKDGSHPKPGQIGARVGNYPHLLRLDDAGLALASSEYPDGPAAPAPTVMASSVPNERLTDAFRLTENDVVEAVCQTLESAGFTIESRASTMQQGVDVSAVRANDQLRVRVEAKGGTSSKVGTNRYGKPFSSGQVRNHVANALATASAAPRSASERSAMAFPDTPRHRKYVERVAAAIIELELGVFWVDAGHAVALDAPWRSTFDAG